MSQGRAVWRDAASSVAPIATAIGTPCILASHHAAHPCDGRHYETSSKQTGDVCRSSRWDVGPFSTVDRMHEDYRDEDLAVVCRHRDRGATRSVLGGRLRPRRRRSCRASLVLHPDRTGCLSVSLPRRGARLISWRGPWPGPLLPLDVATGVAQAPGDWITRTAFFVAIGQFVAWLIARNQHAERDLGATRQTVSVLEGLLERQEGDPIARRWAVERIREVLSAGGPDIVFQPIVDLRDGRVAGVEALARFHVEPKRGPDFWFDEAWNAGLGLDLELAAVLAALRSAGPLLAGWLRVSVNL